MDYKKHSAFIGSFIKFNQAPMYSIMMLSGSPRPRLADATALASASHHRRLSALSKCLQLTCACQHQISIALVSIVQISVVLVSIVVTIIISIEARHQSHLRNDLTFHEWSMQPITELAFVKLVELVWTNHDGFVEPTRVKKIVEPRRGKKVELKPTK